MMSFFGRCKLVFVLVAALAVVLSNAQEGPKLQPRPVPQMQAIPLPDSQISFQRDGREVARYHYGKHHQRPFLFPIIGPSGKGVTRMGHPRDPEGHSHHNSVWISHQSVDGVNFWEDRGSGRIIHERIEKIEDTNNYSGIITLNSWTDESKSWAVLKDRRRLQVHTLSSNELLVTIDLELFPPDNKSSVLLSNTAFGLLGVRVAKSIGVNDGNGIVRNSAGEVNEPAIFRKPAKWVDYSGAIGNGAVEGITLFDHSSNVSHPTPFHVRNDGWFCPSITHERNITITKAKPLRVRYGLHIHSGFPDSAKINATWDEFVGMPVEKW